MKQKNDTDIYVLLVQKKIEKIFGMVLYSVYSSHNHFILSNKSTLFTQNCQVY